VSIARRRALPWLPVKKSLKIHGRELHLAGSEFRQTRIRRRDGRSGPRRNTRLGAMPMRPSWPRREPSSSCPMPCAALSPWEAYLFGAGRQEQVRGGRSLDRGNRWGDNRSKTKIDMFVKVICRLTRFHTTMSLCLVVARENQDNQ